MTDQHPNWRSLLYVPACRQDFIRKAHTRNADAIQLDLEDSVAPGEKAAAREDLSHAVRTIISNRAHERPDVLVRINRPWRLAIRDLEAAVIPGVRAIVLPKVASVDHVRVCDEIVSELESGRRLKPGSISFIAMIETSAALPQAYGIAKGPRVIGLTLGAEDLATDLGIAPEPDLLVKPCQTIVLAARAAGVMPLGLLGTVANWTDADAFAETVTMSCRMGFVGASAIHPGQVPYLNSGFAPTSEEVGRARRLVEVYRSAQNRGIGAINFEGSMVDEPVARRAEALLERAANR